MCKFPGRFKIVGHQRRRHFKIENRLPHIGSDVGTRHEQVAAQPGEILDLLPQRFREDLVAKRRSPATADLCGQFFAADQVGPGVAVHLDPPVHHGVTAGRHEIASGCHPGFAVHIRVIESVACQSLRLVVAFRGAETGAVIVHPGNDAAEFMLVADVGNVVDVGNTGIHPVVETGVGGVFGGKADRSADTVEVIDN